MAPERESCGAASSRDISAGALPPAHPVGEEQVNYSLVNTYRPKSVQESTYANLHKRKTESEANTASADFNSQKLKDFAVAESTEMFAARS